MSKHRKIDVTSNMVALCRVDGPAHDIAIENGGLSDVYLLIDSTGKDASVSEYTTKLPPDGYWAPEQNHTGRVTAICAPGTNTTIQMTGNYRDA